MMILLEIRKIFKNGKGYFRRISNLLFLVSNVFIIVTVISRVAKGNDMYKSDFSKFILIVGLIFLGLRALNQLKMFARFRVLVMVIKQTLKDILKFGIIVIMILFLMTLVNGLYTFEGDTKEIWQNFG